MYPSQAVNFDPFLALHVAFDPVKSECCFEERKALYTSSGVALGMRTFWWISETLKFSRNGLTHYIFARLFWSSLKTVSRNPITAAWSIASGTPIVEVQ